MSAFFMDIDWQTWTARFVVLITAVWFLVILSKQWKNRNRPGCGPQCGCEKPSEFPKQTLSGLPIKKPGSDAPSGR